MTAIMGGPTHAEGAHFASLPTDPLAAYALGMLHILQRQRCAIRRSASGGETLCEGDAMAAQVLLFLSDAQLSTDQKLALVGAIEHATDMDDVKAALLHHELQTGGPAAFNGGVLANQEAEEDHAAQHDEDHEHSRRDSECQTLALDEQHRHSECEIPEALGCAICCDELMLKPVSLLCGHSFCKRCLDMWFKSCASCPTCRQPIVRTGVSASTTAVNLALHEVMTALFPDKLKELEDRDQMQRLDTLRVLIARSIKTGQSIRELVAQQAQLHDGDHDPQADVSHLLEHDSELQEQVLAAEIRERLRKERALREASRRRHMLAYCGAASNSHAQMLSAAMPVVREAPSPSVQSMRPVKKYVPPPQVSKKAAFFGSLMRRMHASGAEDAAQAQAQAQAQAPAQAQAQAQAHERRR